MVVSEAIGRSDIFLWTNEIGNRDLLKDLLMVSTVYPTQEIKDHGNKLIRGINMDPVAGTM